MTKIGNAFGVFLIGLLITASAAARVDVQATVDRNELGIGDTFTLSVTVSTVGSAEVNDPRMPDLKGFELLNSWRSSAMTPRLMPTQQGMQFIEQRSDEFSYLLAAKRKGVFTINAFDVVVDGKAFNTKPITISVGEPGSGSRPGLPRRVQQPRLNNPGFGGLPDEAIDALINDDDPFSALLRMQEEQLQRGGGFQRENRPEPQLRTLPKNHNEAFFVQVEVDKTEVFEGEQVTVSWYIYTRGHLETLDRLKFPDLRGFWKEIVEEVPSIQFTEEIVDGVPYRKALLASHALFPIKAGTAIVDEYRIKSRVRTPSDGFNGFAFNRAQEYTKVSERVKINVKPLPLEGRPKDFSGAVGQFDVNASVENPNVLAQQPFSLKLRFEGNGNAKLIELPAIEWPVGLEVYDTKSDAKFFKNGRSYKEFEILLIPRQTGEIKIPAITFGMFDPQAKKYLSKATQEIVLKVEENPNGAPNPSASVVPGSPAPAAPVVKAPPPGTVLPGLMLTWEKPSLVSQASAPAVAGSLYALALLLLVWKSKVELGWGRRRQSLRDIVNKRYKKLDAAIQKNDYRRVGAEMTNIYNLVLGSISGQEASGLELERMLERISPSLRREYGETLRRQYEAFQIMSFAPENMLGVYKESATVRKEVDSAKSLLQKLINSNPEENEGQKV